MRNYKARKAIRMPKLTVHDLLHTSATMAAQQGATIAELQARIGHSTPNMALRYQHVAANRDKSMAKRISQMATETAERSGDADTDQLDLIDHRPRKPQTKPAQCAAPRPPRPPGQTSRAQRERAAAVRAWAEQNGYEVSARGRLNNEVVKAYDDANARTEAAHEWTGPLRAHPVRQVSSSIRDPRATSQGDDVTSRLPRRDRPLVLYDLLGGSPGSGQTVLTRPR